MIPPIDYGSLSLAATAYACNGKVGRHHLGDPVYQAVTEGRQEQTEVMRRHQLATGTPSNKLAFYSSCADLCHWHYWHMGIQMPWVNRDESKAVDGTGWVVQKNILLLVSASGCAEPCAPGDTYLPGDVLHIGTPGTNLDHVMVVRHHDRDVGILDVAEYGQPGGALHSKILHSGPSTNGVSSRLYPSGPVVYMGTRRLLHVLRLSRVLAEADAAGKLVVPTPAFLALVEPWQTRDTIPAPPPVA